MQTVPFTLTAEGASSQQRAGSVSPLKSQRRVATGESCGLVGVGGVPYYTAEGVTIYHGDCRQLLPLIAPCDLLLTDPPYGIKTSPNGSHWQDGKKRFDAVEWDNEPPPMWLLEEAISLCRQQIIFGGNYFRLPPSSCWLVWNKDNGASRFADAELAWTNLTKAVRMWTYKRHGGCEPMKQSDEGKHHPSQKPLSVISWAIQQASDVQTILDPWMGSGTTLCAARDLGLSAIGIEREEKYCEIAAKRLAQGILSLGGGGAELVAKDSCDSPKTQNQ
jgi:DNA modification methylase